MPGTLLRIDCFGGFRVLLGDSTITRFPTQKAAGLLAYLACHPGPQPREVLVEILWPEASLSAGRANLSQALTMLRRQLEPPGVSPGAVIAGTKTHAGLNPAAFTTDTAEFEGHLRRARQAGSPFERLQALQDAVELYRGELLPGFYEEWVLTEQQRFAGLYLQAVLSLVGELEARGDRALALEVARRAVGVEPLHEELRRAVMRLYAVLGQPAAALEEYRALEQALESELGAEPSASLRRMAQEVQRQLDAAPPGAPLPPLPAPPPTPPALPRGTVTFLFSDIEGSTALWEKAGAAFQAALDTHHRLLRACFAEHGGHEVKEAGDSFLVVFEGASASLACAIAAQQVLDGHAWPGATGPLRVRMALQTGEVRLEHGEYHGPLLHHAARILTAAHGGQVLCAEATAGLLRRSLSPGVQLVDLGVYRLRDVQSPERLFQVNYDGMPRTDFPPLNAEAGYQSNLPLQFTRFFGREEQIAQLREMLAPGGRSVFGVRCWDEPDPNTGHRTPNAERRLVTITGPGGTGKTRLALEVGNRVLEAYRGAVWFVPLVDLTDARLIAGAVVDALRLPRLPTAEPLDQAVAALNRQPSLLILDNLEQFAAESGTLVQALLERVPSLTLLATSRQRLDVAGERLYQLEPLKTPNGPGTPERLTMFESVRLFVDRAQAVRPDFQVTSQNAPSVAELCDRLEGIPLAIELAAARAQVFTPAQMVLQLQNRFAFLVGRPRDASGRHRTLRAAMDWSYELLPPDLQRFFARLSVFRGGWTLEAAEAVAMDGGGKGAREQGSRGAEEQGGAVDALVPSSTAPLLPCALAAPDLSSPALDQLAHLRESSLVLSEETAHGMRFGMLETLREYAAERLLPDEQEGMHRRHVEFFLALAEAAGPLLSGPEQTAWLDRLEAEHDNARAAFAWLNQDPTGAQEQLRLAAALRVFWVHRGHRLEGRRQVEAALAREGAAARTKPRADALHGAGDLTRFQDFGAARRFHEEGLTIYQELDDRQGEAQCLLGIGLVAMIQGDYPQAASLFEQALSISRAIGSRVREAAILSHLGDVAQRQGEYSRARSLLEQARAINRDLGNRVQESNDLASLGVVAKNQGDYPLARSLMEEALQINREVGSRGAAAGNLSNLGLVAHMQADYARSRTLLEEALEINREIGNRAWEAANLHNLGNNAMRQGNPPLAGTLFQEALTLNRELGNRAWEATNLHGLGQVAQIGADYSLAHSLGQQALEIRQAVGDRLGEAVTLQLLGEVAFERNEDAAASAHYAQAVTALHDLGARGDLTGALESVAALLARERAEGGASGGRTQAVQLYGAAHALRAALGRPTAGGDADENEAGLAGLRAALGEDAFAAAWAEGEAITFEDAVALALESLAT